MLPIEAILLLAFMLIICLVIAIGVDCLVEWHYNRRFRHVKKYIHTGKVG